MGQLTDTQLLLLDNLVYLDAASEYSGKKVGELVFDLLSSKQKFDKYCRTGVAYIEPEEWKQILRFIQKDPELRELTIDRPVHEILTVTKADGTIVKDASGKPKEETGMFAVTFVDPENNATVAFRGTGGDYEWRDNGKGGYLESTEQQNEALEYVESLPNYYESLTVTGHSKGGNKAQFVALLSDRVDRCVSFDGQGFSKEFLDAHNLAVVMNNHKIKSISASQDFVNCLLNPVTISYAGAYNDMDPIIVDNAYYVETDKQDEFMYYHKPNILLDGNGQLRPLTRHQSALSQFINQYSIYVCQNMSDSQKQKVMDAMMTFIMENKELRPEAGYYIEPLLIFFSELDAFMKDNPGFVEEVDAEFLDQIREILGPEIELVFLVAIQRIYPKLFTDDLKNRLNEIAQSLRYNTAFILKVLEELTKFGIKQLFRNFKRNLTMQFEQFKSGVREMDSLSKITTPNRWIGLPQLVLRDFQSRGSGRMMVDPNRLSDLKNKVMNSNWDNLAKAFKDEQTGILLGSLREQSIFNPRLAYKPNEKDMEFGEGYFIHKSKGMDLRFAVQE